jgi:hypothetical protein
MAKALTPEEARRAAQDMTEIVQLAAGCSLFPDRLEAELPLLHQRLRERMSSPLSADYVIECLSLAILRVKRGLPPLPPLDVLERAILERDAAALLR